MSATTTEQRRARLATSRTVRLPDGDTWVLPGSRTVLCRGLVRHGRLTVCDLSIVPVGRWVIFPALGDQIEAEVIR